MGALVTKRTAIIDKRSAERISKQAGKPMFFPLPKLINAYTELPLSEDEMNAADSCSVTSSASSDQSSGKPSDSNGECIRRGTREKVTTVLLGIQPDTQSPCSSPYSSSTRANSRSASSASFSSEKSTHSSSSDQSSFLSSPTMSPGVSIDGTLDHVEQCPGDAYSERRIRYFMENHGKLIGMRIRHCFTEAAMDDLIRDATRDDDPRLRYISFKGVREALLQSSRLRTTTYPSCSEYHQALHVNADHSVSRCEFCSGPQLNIGQYEYIHVRDRLEYLIQDAVMGPQLYKYFQAGLYDCFSSQGAEYVDFFSGSLFKDVVKKLGRKESVRHDIFLSLSADGVQPFKSSEYTFWPAVATILNLAPSERFKVRNLLLLLVIPGPNTPKDLTSFLRPFLAELKILSTEGFMVRLWDSRVILVRVHLLLVLADLAAVKMLTKLKGYNGRVPCRFCLIEGVYNGHCYFPHAIIELEKTKKRGNKIRKCMKTYWKLESLPIRTPQSIAAGYSDVQELAETSTNKAVQEKLTELGYSSIHPSPLLELPTVPAFVSFPPDIMHLLFENVAKDVIGLWKNESRKFPDLGFLSSPKNIRAVSKTSVSCTRTTDSSTRSQRNLAQSGSWKANEWKYFTLSSSLVALSGWLPEDILDGWNVFVRLVRRLCQWKLSSALVGEIEELGRDFYSHFSTVYYKFLPERVSLCRYVYHLLLHLADSIRQCGPISLVAQWSMENYVGQLKRSVHAKTMYAQSVRENVKFQEAALLFCSREKIVVPYLNDVDSHVGPDSLRCRRNMTVLDGFELRHPRTPMKSEQAQNTRFPKFMVLLERYYKNLYDTDMRTAKEIVRKNRNVVIWERLHDQKTLLQAPFTYRGYAHARETKRGSPCYFSGSFQDSTLDEIMVYYGRALAFVEHQVGQDTHILFIAEWVRHGMHKGRQGQVLKKCPRKSPYLFTSCTIESVSCMTHPVGTADAEVPDNRGGISKRTYIIDDLSEQHGLLSSKPWDADIPVMKLQGLDRKRC